MARPRKVAVMLARARGGRRRLSDWMILHHDELLEQIGTGRIDWQPVMDVIGQLDLRDEHGQPVTRDTAARTWARVRRRATDRRDGEAAKGKPQLRPGEIAPGVRSLGSASGPATRPSLELDISPARPREGVPANHGPSSVRAEGEAAERLKTVIEAFGAARVPMPKRTS